MVTFFVSISNVLVISLYFFRPTEFYLISSMKNVLLILVAIISFSSSAQNITISGKILEKDTQVPLEAATVYLSSAADSTLIDYTITNKDGSFIIKTKIITAPVILKASFIGFKTLQKRESEITENKDFGILYLEDDARMLNEVVVLSEAPPIRVKKDTLEFNASSFKVRPDANVETLLKQLPGVEIDPEGKITVNGKEVNQVLVNGKPFFDKDGKIALQNLPSDLINKVQITDTKTKEQEITGRAATSNNASINLTIDEDKNKGLFGKAMAGYGTEDRYESSLLVNYFKGKQKVSVLASSNNINNSGFSMNEVFDSMGGGRNRSISNIGGGQGITQSDMLGVNYSDEFFKDFQVSGSYFYNTADSENKNRTRTVNFLPDGDFTTTSERQASNTSDRHNFNSEIEYKIDSTATVVITPKFSKSSALSEQSGFENSINTDGNLLNDSNYNDSNSNETTSFSNEIYVDKKINAKGRAIGIKFNNENSKNTGETLSRSLTKFYNEGVLNENRTDQRNQRIYVENLNDYYKASVSYRDKITDSLELRINLGFEATNQAARRNTFDFDSFTDSFAVYNDTLTRYTGSEIRTASPQIGFGWDKQKFNLSFEGGTNISELSAQSFYLGQQVGVQRNYILPTANAQFNYRFTQSMMIYTNYGYRENFGSAQQLLPVADFINPLNTEIGNPTLDPEKNHSFYFTFRNYKFATKSGYSIYAGGNYYAAQIISSTIFDSSRKRTTTYENISDAYSVYFGGNYSKTIKKDAHSFKYGVSANTFITKNKGFTNGDLYDASSLILSPRINLAYEYGELLTINPSYSISYSQTDYTNYLVDRVSNTTHRINLQTTSYWPKKVVFGNDVAYDYNANIADGFKKDFILWNMSLGYNFYDDKLLAKVKIYDILNQNQSATRTISATMIRDEENTVLQRYLMFSLTYKLEMFGGIPQKSRSRMRGI